jgi:hypothetical protein
VHKVSDFGWKGCSEQDHFEEIHEAQDCVSIVLSDNLCFHACVEVAVWLLNLVLVIPLALLDDHHHVCDPVE